MSWNKHRERLQFTLIGALIVAVGCLAIRPFAPGQEEIPPIAIGAMGWVDSAEDREPVTETLPKFADTPAFKAVRGEEPKQVYLWEAYRRLHGVNPPERNQGSVGSCVGFGTTNAIEATLANQVIVGLPGEFKEVAQEIIYGGSRVEIGGGRIRGDGSIGAWAAKFVTKFGIIPRGVIGRYDLSTYDEARCRAWGRSGVPDDIEPEAKKYPVGDAALVTSWSEAKKALANGYGISVCSDQGFTMRRDARGMCRPSGTWMHCMCLDGYHIDADGKEYGHITNSWGGNAHTGPVGWGDPNQAGFWTDSRTIDRMLRQDDSFAFSGVTGFPARKIDWDILLRPIPQPRRERALALVPQEFDSWLAH